MKVKFVLSALLLGVVLVTDVQNATVEISSYSKVSKSGDSSVKLNATSSTADRGSGRALSGGSYQYPFQGLLTKPVNYRTSSYQDSYKSPKYIVYPSNSQAISPSVSSSKDVAMDRFAPGEAYGGTVYKILKAKQKGYLYQKPSGPALDDKASNLPSGPSAPSATTLPALPPPISPPQLPPAIVAPTPVPPGSDSMQPPSVVPTDLNKFPPNSDSSWPASIDSPPSYNSPVTSYLGPEPDNPKPPIFTSGPTNQYIPPSDLHNFPPNINSNYLPPPTDGQFRFNGLSSYLPPPAGPSDSSDSGPPSDSDDMIGTISVGSDSQYLPPKQPYLPPDSPQPMGMPMNMPMNMPMSMQMPGPPQTMMDMGMPPMMGGPPMDTDHSYPFSFDEHFYPHDHYPEYSFDPHHDEPKTTVAPPPPEPGTARVKNYSYYYISRTLWYVPLYFTLYFCFYVLVLILRSIARHKVNIPNQWVGSRSLEAMPNMSNAQMTEKVNKLTSFVMAQIEDFKDKYVG